MLNEEKSWKVIFIIGLSIILFISGCSLSNQNIGPKPLEHADTEISTKYSDVLKSAISVSLNQRIEKIDIVFSKEVSNKRYLSQFLFTIGKNLEYEGDSLATFDDKNGWSIERKGYQPIDKSLPLTHMEMSGEMADGSKYEIVSGKINNPEINYVLLYTIDGQLAKVMASTSNTYSYVRTDSVKGVKKIEGYSKDDKLIFSQQF